MTHESNKEKRKTSFELGDRIVTIDVFHDMTFGFTQTLATQITCAGMQYYCTLWKGTGCRFEEGSNNLRICATIRISHVSIITRVARKSQTTHQNNKAGKCTNHKIELSSEFISSIPVVQLKNATLHF